MLQQLAIILLIMCPLCVNAQKDKELFQLIAEGDYDKTIGLSDEILARDSSNYRIYLAKGKALEKLYKYNESIMALEKAEKLKPNNTDVLSTLAGLYFNSGQLTKAVEVYDYLIELEPNVVNWRMSCAIALQAAGMTRGAISELSFLMKADSTNWLVFKHLGECYLRVNDLKIAAQCYREALARNPGNLVLTGQLAGMYIKMEMPKASANVSKRALGIDSTFREGLRWLGIAYYTIPYRDSSLVIFERLWNLGDSSALVSRYLGMLYHQNAGKQPVHKLDEVYAKSEHHLRKALVEDPENIDVLYTLGSVCGMNSKEGEGLKVFNTLDTVLYKYEIMKAYTEAEKGKLYRQSKQFAKAVQSYRKAIQILPDKGIYLYEVALCYDLWGNKKQALDGYKRFLAKVNPDWEKKLKQDTPPLASYENVALGRVKDLTDELFMQNEL